MQRDRLALTPDATSSEVRRGEAAASRAATGLSPPLPRFRAELTCRELAIAGLLLRGLSNRRIAVELGISPHTVRDHVSAMLVKFRFENRVQLAAHFAMRTVGEINSGKSPV